MITRKPANIEETIEALREVWQRHPGMNLVQIVLAVAMVDPDNPNKTIGFDPRYVQDVDWAKNAEVYPYLQTSANTDSQRVA